MPSLRTSLCMLLGPGALPSIGHKIVIIIHVCSVIIGVFRRIKIFIIIFYKLVDLIEAFRVKVITLNDKLSFDSFGKKLRLICTSPGGFRIEMQCRIIALTLWFEKVFNFMQKLNMISF